MQARSHPFTPFAHTTPFVSHLFSPVRTHRSLSLIFYRDLQYIHPLLKTTTFINGCWIVLIQQQRKRCATDNVPPSTVSVEVEVEIQRWIVLNRETKGQPIFMWNDPCCGNCQTSNRSQRMRSIYLCHFFLQTKIPLADSCNLANTWSPVQLRFGRYCPNYNCRKLGFYTTYLPNHSYHRLYH